jgi:Zn-dependent protease
MLLIVRIGWGKPVQFDAYNLENPKRDAAIISLAGPASNLILAGVLAILARLGGPVLLITPFVFLNVVLAIFNLLPIHPLDGGKILVGLLPPKDAAQVDQFLRQYGLFVLILLIFPTWHGLSPVSYLISPVINLLLSIMLPGNGII